MNAKHFIQLAALLLVCCMMFGCTPDNVDSGVGSIFGIVTDKSTGDCVPNAGVELMPKGLKTVTGSDGSFEFADIDPGQYNLFITKVGYQDLKSSAIIVKSGEQAKGDVQIEKLPASLLVLNNDGDTISELDFGGDEGITTKTFNIFNGGTENLNYNIIKTADWIENISQPTGTVNVGVTFPIVVRINRELLSNGVNTTTLLITSASSGGVELKIKARKGASGDVVELPAAQLMVQTEDLGCVDWSSAKLLCENSTVADFNDWRLPTLQELMTLYSNRDLIGGFADDRYWSSTMGYSYHYYVNFSDGNSNTATHSNDRFFVRAVRTYDGSAPLNLTDNSGNEITELDFGSDQNTTQKTFKIKNTGAQNISYTVTNTANWIVSANPSSGELSAGSTTSVVVTINRNLLANGDNSSSLLINTPNNGSKELVVKAKKTVANSVFELAAANLMVQTQDLGCVNWNSAKTMCESSTVGNYSDWRLPTKEELMALYNNRELVGGFTTGKYWSSTYASGRYYALDFNNGTLDDYSTSQVFNVRAVRPLNGSSITTPTVTTTAPSNVTTNSAICGGNVTFDGGATVTQRGICYSTSQNPTTSSQTVSSGSGTGSFTCNLTGLSANTKYYVRAYATNSKGTSYGEQKSFTTESGGGSGATAPTVTTTSPYNISTNSATCGGNVTSDGGASVTQRGICYSTLQNPTTSSMVVTSGSGTGSFTCNLTGLSENTTYYVRAFANNSEGISYGGQVSFTTSTASINDWLQYDDGTGINAIGFTNGGTIYWADMFPASMLSQYAGTSITEMELLLNLSGVYTLQIYSGGTTAPGSLVYELTINHSYSDFGWYNVVLPDAVLLNTSQNLWIVLGKTHSAGDYPAGCCANSGEPNGRWVSDGSGTWMDSEDYTWGIHTFVTNQTKTGNHGKAQIISSQIEGIKLANP